MKRPPSARAQRIPITFISGCEMSGLAKGGVAIVDGGNLAIAGIKPSGVAVQGQVIWIAKQWQFLLAIAAPAASYSATPAVDTTGADLLVFFSTRLTAATGYTKSDSANNVWMPGVSLASGAYTSEVFYCIRPLTSTQHVFQAVSSNATTVLVAAFKTPLSFAFDQQSSIGTVAYVSSIQLPAITPSAPNSLVITSLAAGWGAFVTINSIDSSFLILEEKVTQTPAAALQALAYNVVPNAAPVTPTWSMSPADRMIATMLSFIPSPPEPTWQLLASSQGTTVTSAIDTTGARLLVIVCAQYGNNSVSDSQENNWTLGVNLATASSYTSFSTIYYCINPLTSTTHTFNLSGAWSSFFIMAFRGPNCVADQQSTIAAIGQPATLTLPSISIPAEGLVISGVVNIDYILSVDSDLTIAKMSYPASPTRTGAAAYLIASEANPLLAPTWTITTSLNGIAGATMLSFVPSPWQLLGSASIVAPALTSNPIDTTGANLLVATFSYANPGPAFGFTDSEGQAWTFAGSTPNSTTAVTNAVYYCINPVTSPAYTISVQSAALYASCFIQAFKGPANLSFGQVTGNNNNNASSTANQLPAITPTANNSLVVTSIGLNATASAIDSGFTITGSQPFINGGVFGGAMAYRILGAATSVSPTWTLSAGTVNYYSAAVMLSFIPS